MEKIYPLFCHLVVLVAFLTFSFGAKTQPPHGSASLAMCGGIGSFSFLRSNEATTQNLPGLPPGAYSVTVSTGTSCSAHHRFYGRHQYARSCAPAGRRCSPFFSCLKSFIMKKNTFFLLLLLFASQTLYGQYFKTTFTYSAGLLNFYVKPTGGSINAALQSFQFDVTYPIGANINFGSITNNTTDFPGLNVTATNLFTLNGEWVKRWEHQGAIPQQVYTQNTEYLVFSVQLSGLGSTTLGYKSDYVNFDPVFTVNDDMGTPLWDDTPPYDVYYPNQQQSGDIIYILLNVSLPLELSHFGTHADQESINLTWTTQNEQNFFGFEVQRSMDGIDFSKIDFLEGRGNNESNDYNYIDQEVRPNVVYYYRLKMLDFDGVSSYSKISQPFYLFTQQILRLYPTRRPNNFA